MTTRSPTQFSLRRLLVLVTFCAVVIVGCHQLYLAIRPIPFTPHERAISSVNNRDGWAREDKDGFVIADLNGGTIPITDQSLLDLTACRRLRKLTAYETAITDNGLVHLRGHDNLKILHLDKCAGITDGAIPHLIALTQLEELSINGTAISEYGLRALRNALPNCTIRSSKDPNPVGGANAR